VVVEREVNRTNQTTPGSGGRSLFKKDLTGPTLLEMSGYPGGFYRSMQHHLMDLLFKDGVYERRKTIETFSHPEIRDLEPLEVRAVVA
jgi:hypothetical protein